MVDAPARRRSVGRSIGSTWRTSVGRLGSRQINLLLAVAVVGALVTGFVSWGVGTGWARWWTALHAVFGVLAVVLAPAKARGSVRRGMRRSGPTRWISVAFGVVVLASVGFGLVHTSGAWTGVGLWSPLWTHVLLGASAIPLLAWHLWARPTRPRAVDLDRRLLLGGGVAAVAATAAVATVEAVAAVAGTGDRAATGSHEVGSFDPDEMPTVSWIDDTAPTTPRANWTLRIDGHEIDLDDLDDRSTPMVAALDCTGGWFSRQQWDVVPVAALLSPDAAARRSFEIVSATGFRRIYPMRDAANVHLAVGYGGRPLRRGHGAPVRVVAPGRRGPWWVKWVVAVESTDRPWWLQLPFPPT